VLLSTDREFLGRYDKIHLVPLGEYVPLRDTLPFIARFTPYDDDYSCKPGEKWIRFPLKTADGRAFTFGCLICYEDSDPYLARQYATPDRPVDFLVNISNDGWFRGTEEHEEHLAICQFRAVEARRTVVRAVNMGISGVIDPDGRVTTSLPKQVEGVVHATVAIDGRLSWYARTGDWLPGLSWTSIAIGLLLARLKGRASA
jgi:apolipoprotein N-acyltransferase